MSKVFNMVGGGGGGKNISSIIITGLSSTDTVTCTKDGKSYAATWDSTAQHWEIVGLPLGTFSLTATNGTKTTTKTVLIDIAGVYEIEMSFILWLYRDGDEYTDETGGWIASSAPKHESADYTAYAPTVTKNSASMYVSITSSSSQWRSGSVRTQNAINFAGKNTLHLVFDVSKAAAGSDRLGFHFGCYHEGSALTSDAFVFEYSVYTATASQLEYSLDVSGIYEPCFVAVTVSTVEKNSTVAVTVHDVWLE